MELILHSKSYFSKPYIVEYNNGHIKLKDQIFEYSNYYLKHMNNYVTLDENGQLKFTEEQIQIYFLLIDEDMEINYDNFYFIVRGENISPIYYISNKKTIQSLLDTGLNFNDMLCTTGLNILMLHHKQWYNDISFLINFINIYHQDNYGKTCLCYIGDNIHIYDKFKPLLATNLRDINSCTLLMEAANKQWNYSIIYLIENNYNQIDEVDNNGNTILMFYLKSLIKLISHYNYDNIIINYLINKGIDINAKNRTGQNALMYALSLNYLSNDHIVKYMYLFKHLKLLGLDLSTTDSENKTVRDYINCYSHEMYNTLENILL